MVVSVAVASVVSSAAVSYSKTTLNFTVSVPHYYL